MVHLILELSRLLSSFPRSICSFRDLREVTRGYSPPWNDLLNPRYIFKKSWYIWSSGYQDLYIPSYGPFDHLGAIGKWLQAIPHLGMDFGTLGTSLSKFYTSLRKIGTSNPWATKTPISLLKVHLFLLGPLRSDWRSFPMSEQTVES